MTRYLYSGNITGVKFSLSGTKEAIEDSNVTITTWDLFRNNQPYPGGVYDAHTGTTDHSYKCQTCSNDKKNCIGHEGEIKLNYPVWNPIAVAEGRKWLRIICFHCGKPILEPSVYSGFPKNKRLDEASKIAKTSIRSCYWCKEVHPMVKKHPIEKDLGLIAEFYDPARVGNEKRITNKFVLFPHMIKEIMSRISDETVIDLGKSPCSHPRNCILDSIKVPSVAIRPDIKKQGGGRSTNDALTTLLQIIIKKNPSMNVIPAEIDLKFERIIFELNNAYYDFVRSSGEKTEGSIATRLKGKGGRFRKNQLGKRARNMCRSTIAGDPTLMVDQVGIPISFARTIQVEEVVQDYNRQQMLQYVMNGRKKYPGATKIIRADTGAEYDVESSNQISNGDIIMRDLIDGDHVNFNRQPSLLMSNISAMRAKIILNPDIKTLLMNVAATPWFNADFDGDAMNIIISASAAARNEISNLSSPKNWFISHTNSDPVIGQVEDSIVGNAELTRTGVNLDKYHAMLLFQNTTRVPDFSDVAASGTITGRECISKLLVETPINFSRSTTWYQPNMSPWVNYKPDETHVNIVNGVLERGILDKKSIGKGSNGGIFHIVANEYGPSRALELIFDMQQVGIGFIYQHGYTIGINDLVIPLESKRAIDAINSDIINESRLITDQLQSGNIIPPIGKTVEEYFEEQQISILSIFDDFTEAILNAINPETNNLFKIINYGSKGKIVHLFNMMSAIGQKLINGERINEKFGYKRTLPYFPRFDTSPEARGFITNSYLSGMTSREYIFNAMASRFDLISKALSTATTGDQNRKSIKNLESMIINNFRWAIKNQNVIEFAYGEDYLDPRYVERVHFPTVMINDADFEKYRHPQFPEFFSEMASDRKQYRKIFASFENINVKELMSDWRLMPVNIERIVKDHMANVANASNNISADAKEPLKSKVELVNKLCLNIPYILLNEIQERLQTAIPEHLRAATWLLRMQIRSWMHPKALESMSLITIQLICEKIRLVYSNALIEPGTACGIIAAQSFSEPLTQYMLDAHHRSASGGTSKSSMTRAKEILGAKSVDNLVTPSMLVALNTINGVVQTKQQVQEIANRIEVMYFKQFINQWQIFFEKFGEPVHSQYIGEAAMIKEFIQLNPLVTIPGDLVRWCIRFTLDKTTMILKNMSIDVIIGHLRDKYPDLFFVYTNDNANIVVIRVYMRNSYFKSTIALVNIKTIKDALVETIIRGVDHVMSTSVVPVIRHEVDSDGSVKRVTRHYISTTGTNLRGMMSLRCVDKTTLITESIQETNRVFGIEAARQRIVSELRGLVDGCNHRHYLTYANEMTYTGKVTSIESSGLKTRESSNILLRIGSSAPLATLEEAAANSMEDKVTGVSAPLLVGSIPRNGTLYNTFHVNGDFIRKHIKSPDDFLDDL